MQSRSAPSRSTRSDADALAGSHGRTKPWLTPLLLAVACALGVATRLWPLHVHAAWGSDTGEYFLLTERLVETGRVTFAYDGWGLAYPYFPGHFVLTGGVTALLGVDLLDALHVAVPLLAGIAMPLAMFVLVRTLTDSDAGAVFAAFGVAVLAPFVIVTNHSMPATVGHVLGLSILAVLALSYQDRRFAVALPVLVVALVWSHHLSLLFVTGAIVAGAFMREMTRERFDLGKLAIEAPLVVGLVAGASFWWMGVATRFREQIVGNVLPGAAPWLLALGCYALLLVPVAVVLLRRRFTTRWTSRNPWIPRRWPSLPVVAVGSAVTFAGLVATIALVVNSGVPGAPGMIVTYATLKVLVTPLAFLSFTLTGLMALRFSRHRHLAYGWFAALTASAVFGAVTKSQTLIMYRHVDHLALAALVFSAAGFAVAVQTLREAAPASRRRAVNAGIAAFLVVLVASGTAMSQVPREAIANFEEGVSPTAWDAIVWAKENLAGELTPYADPHTTVIAADHPASSFLWGYAKVPATFDYAHDTYHAERAEDAFAEMWRVQAPPPPAGRARIDYVFMSPELRAGVALLQWENALPMSEASIRKFYDSPYFEQVYPRPGCNAWPECFDAEGTQIFRVEWARILEDWTPDTPGAAPVHGHGEA